MKIIAIEGLDGSGKETQAKILYERIKKEFDNVYFLSFPQYGTPQAKLIEMYLAEEIKANNPLISSIFYIIDRYVTLQKSNFPDDSIVICDRYSLSNILHQLTKLKYNEWETCAKNLNRLEYEVFNNEKPIINIFLHMTPEMSYNLIMKRYNNDSSKTDLHERLDYLSKCYDIISLYKNNDKVARFCLGDNFKMIDCVENEELRSIDDISSEVYDIAIKYIK